jgi:bacteriorhodopsin
MILAFAITVATFTQLEDRSILFIEMCITGISSYMYYLFLQRLKTNSLHSISILRYTGWVITTPLMLIALSLLLHIPMTVYSISYLIGLDWLMLLAGYLGELGTLPRMVATLSGFIPFVLLFYTLYSWSIFTSFTYVIFWIYFIVWASYGIAYLCREPFKNGWMNVLDSIAKGVVAIAVSVYFLNQEKKESN